VDDDAALRALLAATFPAEEFEVVSAATVKEGLELAERERPDLVVLDWRLPDGSGADVLAGLRQRYPELPVIVLTAEREAETGGADGHLVKPFSPVGLLGLVERLLAP
jgi:DNA-binding response OmpR family regulator